MSIETILISVISSSVFSALIATSISHVYEKKRRKSAVMLEKGELLYSSLDAWSRYIVIFYAPYRRFVFTGKKTNAEYYKWVFSRKTELDDVDSKRWKEVSTLIDIYYPKMRPKWLDIQNAINSFVKIGDTLANMRIDDPQSSESKEISVHFRHFVQWSEELKSELAEEIRKYT